MFKRILSICALIFFSTYGIAVEFNLSDREQTERYALVTGATRGIGRSIIVELIKKDPTLKIFAVARTKNDVQQLFEEYPIQIIPLSADLSCTQDLEHIIHTVRSTLSSHGALAYLIHNAALIEPIGDLHYLQRQSLTSLSFLMEATYKTNVIAPHLVTLSLLPQLIKSTCARVLFISSGAGEHPVPGAITYSCTKAALDQLARNLYICVPKTVAIGVLNPGVVDTDMHATLRTYPEEQFSLVSKFRAAKENNELISPLVSAQFVIHLLYDTSVEEFSSKKWSLYFTRPNNCPAWLSHDIGSPPHYITRLPNQILKSHCVLTEETLD
jgi:benzil reductase ((S)-benzoin forming)